MRWAEPIGSGTPPPEKYCADSQIDSAIPASSSEASTCWPSPVRSRWTYAARIACSASRPAARSVTGTPHLAGGRPGSPVTDISPDIPCATRSKPPRAA